MVLFSSLKNSNPKRNFCSLSSNLEQKKSKAPPPHPLLGPPSIHCPDYLPEWCYFSNYPRIYTEKWSPTFVTTGNPCPDFFFHVVPDTPASSLKQRLRSAWNHDPLKTLKLVCNLRGVRGTGKSDKDGFYTAANWLHENHPKTLAANVGSIAGFGYLKDLPEILYQLVQGPDVRRNQKAELAKAKKNIKGAKEKTDVIYSVRREIRREIRVRESQNKDREKKWVACLFRKERRQEMAQKAFYKYSDDPDYRFLFERISDYFAEHLKNDMKFYESGELRKVFPRELYPEYEEIEEAHYAYRVRNRLRKQVLVPLRKVLELPEVYIGANRWDMIPYSRVASVAMSLYKEKFLKHDHDRFKKYLDQVKEGKKKINAGALLPHQIIKSLRDGDGGQVAELQWKRMVDDLLEEGKLRNCMAVSDVSGSMKGTPKDVAVALGILVSELSEDPWKGKLITFSKRPVLQILDDDDLKSKTEFLQIRDRV
ncbi:hypothetical protein LWI29_003829 [Acer saccharum]|uniref:Uncharacterized protein n=1 Tax=Acer saccharum TaxID=4024 RepID=A0AA39RHV7_ACESA|nr:hypothetical protein LWI29_003829 [Acer saccharum]